MSEERPFTGTFKSVPGNVNPAWTTGRNVPVRPDPKPAAKKPAAKKKTAARKPTAHTSDAAAAKARVDHGYLVWNITQKRVEASLGVLPDKQSANDHIDELIASNARVDSPVEWYETVEVSLLEPAHAIAAKLKLDKAIAEQNRQHRTPAFDKLDQSDAEAEKAKKKPAKRKAAR